MKQLVVIAAVVMTGIGSVALTEQSGFLREIYSRPTSQWPAPTIDAGVQWKELEALPKPDSSRIALLNDPQVILGKTLFFDPRLSASNQVSCSSCHDPDLSWADGRAVSLGHDHQQGKRNTQSLLNVARMETFFWDGRARSLQQQAINPISTHHEMAEDLTKLVPKIRAIKGYHPLFKAAYGSEEVSMEGILDAIAAFEETIVSRSNRFDEFVRGKHNSLTDEEIEGLHLFRTKARCMNCHFGPDFSDQQFHNIGLTYYGRKYEDLGRYQITKKAEDVGKFRTPSLRDVMRTRPWMHNGLFDDMDGIINMYNNGMPQPKPQPHQLKDTLFPKTDPLIKKLDLTASERKALAAFLQAITAAPFKVQRPELPK
jgi:cytochrome c peroxidase